MRSSFMSCSVHPLSLSLASWCPCCTSSALTYSVLGVVVGGHNNSNHRGTQCTLSLSLSVSLAPRSPLTTSLHLSVWLCRHSSFCRRWLQRSCVVINWVVVTSAFGSSMFRHGCGFVTLWPCGRVVFVEEPIADVMTVCKKHARHARHWLSALLPQEPTSNSQAVLPTVWSTPFHQHPFIGKQCLMCLSIVPETKGQAKPTAANLQREQNN